MRRALGGVLLTFTALLGCDGGATEPEGSPEGEYEAVSRFNSPLPVRLLDNELLSSHLTVGAGGTYTLQEVWRRWEGDVLLGVDTVPGAGTWEFSPSDRTFLYFDGMGDGTWGVGWIEFTLAGRYESAP